MAKKITWWAAAEIIGVSDRTMRRWRERFESNGYDGLMDQRKGKPASQWVELRSAAPLTNRLGAQCVDCANSHGCLKI